MNSNEKELSENEKVYRVMVCSEDFFSILLKAKNEDDAWDIGKSIDGGFFKHENCDSWDIIRAEQVDQFNPNDLAPSEAYGSL